VETSLSYNHHTTIATSIGEASLDFAANTSRAPVSFKGRVKEPHLLRQLMFALNEVIVSTSAWVDEAEWALVLDPVITVHPDQVFFEAFSNDESAYARLSAPLSAFETDTEPFFGTTNVDFTAGLRDALQDMRSSQVTTFQVGAEGFGVETAAAPRGSHFERKVDVPDGWLKGFLQVQSAFTMHPFVFDVRPIDLLAVIAFLEDNKALTPPHGLRYEFRKGEPIKAVLEPWNEAFVLRDTGYEGYDRTVRVWGRRRLALLQHVLPYAQKVSVGLLGRGLPHFYICDCGRYRFVLALSGWTGNDWSKGAALDLMAPRGQADAEAVAAVHGLLSQEHCCLPDQIGERLSLPQADVTQALFELCRAGRVMFDPGAGLYRLRELFDEPLDLEALFPPDTRTERAEAIVAEGGVEIGSLTDPDAPDNWRHEYQATATVSDDGGELEVYIAIDQEGRLRFGRCECPFFKDNIMSRGPCEHIQAARMALENTLREEGQVDTTGEEEA